MASAGVIVTFTAHCCFGDFCGKKWKRLGRFATVEEAREEIRRHLCASSKHSMTPTEAMTNVQTYTVIGSEECCVQQVTEGPIPEAKSSSSNSARLRSRSPIPRLIPVASRGETIRYPVELPAYIEEDASVIEHTIQAIDEIADYFGAHTGNTTLEEVPHLLDDIRNINVLLSAHVEQLRRVVVNMRKYTI
jgi:hypothetical protein